MKNIILKLSFIALVFSSFLISGQVLTNQGLPISQFTNNNAFMEAVTNFDTGISGSNINGKGFVFPRTDLTSWDFLISDLDAGYIQTSYGGMIVYNTGTGNTPTTGNNPTISTAVTPGFYYFSNPTITAFDAPSFTAGQWIRLGGADSASKTVEVTGTADGINTLLDLGTATIAANSVTRFISARVYLADDLVMEASVDYDKATNIFVTGNGALNTLLPAGTYTVVLEYQ
jgi:hypothetical protein